MIKKIKRKLYEFGFTKTDLSKDYVLKDNEHIIPIKKSCVYTPKNEYTTDKTKFIELANKVELPKKRKLSLKKELNLKAELRKLGIDPDKEL